LYLSSFWNQYTGILTMTKINGPLRLYDLSGERILNVSNSFDHTYTIIISYYITSSLCITLMIILLQDIELRSSSLPRRLTADKEHLYMVGFEDGSIRFFDSRLPNDQK
jgi:hypothetical protein